LSTSPTTPISPLFPYTTLFRSRYVDLTSWTSAFARTAAFTEHDLAVGVGAEAREMRVGIVSASFFGFFDAPPALGRYFTAAEDRDRKSTRLNSSHEWISYAVFC